MSLKPSGLAVVFGLFAAFALPAVAADEKKAKPPELVGKYECVGDSGGGNQYKGAVEISEQGAGYKVEWTIGEESYAGVGLWENDRLCVSWQMVVDGKPVFGVIVYSRDKDGTLKGKWTESPAAEKLKEETLTPKKK